jgi:hypothetical protein
MHIQFNAIDYAQQLEAAGVPLVQAEVHAKTLSLALTNCAASHVDLQARDERITARIELFVQRITTRMDLFEQRSTARMDQFEQRITARMDQFEARIELHLEKSEGRNRITRWMAATNSAMLIALIMKVYFP